MEFITDHMTETIRKITTRIEVDLLHRIAKDPAGYFWVEHHPTEYGSFYKVDGGWQQDNIFKYHIGEIPGFIFKYSPWLIPRMFQLDADIRDDRVRENMDWYMNADQKQMDKWWRFEI